VEIPLLIKSIKEELNKRFLACRVLLSGVILVLANLSVTAQTTVNEYKTWTEFHASTKIGKERIRLHLAPEVRFNENFTIDKYIIEAGIRYELHDFIMLGAGYRFIGNKLETKSTDYLHRFAFSVTFEKGIKRFEPEFRIRYTNYSDDDLEENYLRYKAALQYDIPKCKIMPFISAQAFHKLAANRIEKMRYGLGAEYKLRENNYIGVFYKLDYFLHKFKNRHIIGITYRIKLQFAVNE